MTFIWDVRSQSTNWKMKDALEGNWGEEGGGCWPNMDTKNLNFILIDQPQDFSHMWGYYLVVVVVVVVQMRSLVTSSAFLLKKHLMNFLHWLLPNTFMPLYSMVSTLQARLSIRASC